MVSSQSAQQDKVRKPRYQELAEELRASILAGEFGGSDSFPTESVLCARYAVSRFTVREALRVLQSEGLIQRRRGSGTVIKPSSARNGALHQPLSNVGEILQYSRDTQYRFSLRGLVSLPKQIATHIGAVGDSRWFHFHGPRTREGQAEPVAITDAYVPLELADAVAQIVPDEAIFRQLERHAEIKIGQVTQDIQAVPAGAVIATALGVPRRSACLRILRCFHDADGRIIEISASHHPGDRFAYSMHIEVDS